MSPSLPVVVPFLIFTGNKIIILIIIIIMMMMMMMMMIMITMIIIIIMIMIMIMIIIIIIIIIIIAGKHITAKMTNPALALYKYKTNVQ